MYHRKRMRKAMATYMKMQRGAGSPGSTRRRRPLGHGDLRLLILSLIAAEPRHGYDLITEIEHLSGGAYKPSAGVMYPALSVIQDQGLAKSKKEQGKRIFYITPDGEAELAAHAEALAQIESRLSALADQGDAANDPSDVRAASRSLRFSVFKAVTNDWPDTSKHEAIVAILNQARTDITRLADSEGTPPPS